MKHLKNIIAVAFSNAVGFGTSFIIGFILPAILSVSAYGEYRQFMLYTSFAYIFNLGFNDGIYIKYGGIKLRNVNRDNITKEHGFIITFHLIIAILMFIFFIITRNSSLLLYAIAVLLMNIITFHENFLQAIGEFKLYSRSNILKNSFYIASLLLFILYLEVEKTNSYIGVYIASLFLIFLIYEITFHRHFGLKNMYYMKTDPNLFYIGLFILVANMSLTFVANIGNWVVNFNYPINDFAQYSFQNSLLNVILLIVNAIGLVFYNVISQKSNKELLNMIKKICLFLGVSSGLAFFIFKKIILTFLPDYGDSIGLLSITFVSIPYIMTSKILIANLYKVNRAGRKYFKDSIIFALISFIFVLVTNIIISNLITIAISTTLSYIFWFIYCINWEFKELKISRSELFMLVSHCVIFLLSSNYLSDLVGPIIYMLYIILILYFDKKEMTKILAFIF